MSKHLVYIVLFFVFHSFGQNQELAKTFFNDGEYAKALLEYDKLVKKQPRRVDFFLQKIKCHQELEQLDIAEKLLKEKLKEKYIQPQLYVDLGYNYTLKKDTVNARKTYNKAINFLNKNANHAYAIGVTFENYGLLKEAKETYNKAISLNVNVNFDLQLANIYGQLNELEKMFDSYLKLLQKNKSLTVTIQNLIHAFITENPQNENNILFKRALLKRLQATPNLLWNEQLSWLYVQQKELNKAFTQEKAIFKREGGTLNRIFDLALIAKEHHKYDTAILIFDFIQEQPLEQNTQIKVLQYVLNMKTARNNQKEYDNIAQEYKIVLDSFGITNKTVNIQLDYANFLAFQALKVNEAVLFLKEHQEQSLGKFDKARYQMKLADILVSDTKFNQALLNYSKIQRSLKNNVLSQEATFKIAKTSYYKGDFDWALQQLKVLKSATSQLIANDALDLHLLINDHTKDDSLYVALKEYAKADLLVFQNKKEKAKAILTTILKNYKGDKIEDDALFLQAKLFEATENYQEAKNNYTTIITNFKESVFVDDALFRLAYLYLDKLDEKDKAQEYFEALIFNHADSIHFVEAQKMYRKLRGDDVLGS